MARDIEIPVEDSPIPNALDQYYSHLYNLLEPTEEQNVCLNSTLVTFDIVKDAPLYTENVFRGYADRKIRLSPSKFGFGPADISDRFSELYRDVLLAVVSSVDRSLDQEQLDKIDNIRREIKVVERELADYYIEISDRWRDYKEKSGITDEDPEILEKQIAFYNSFYAAGTIRRLSNEIAQLNEDIEFIRVRAYPDDESRLLARYYRYAAAPQYEMARPNSAYLEGERGYNELQLAQMWIYGNLGGVFDASAEVRPSGTLAYFLENEGHRDFKVEKSQKAEHQHDRKWGASGSARRFIFFKAKAEASYETHLKTSLEQTVSIEIGCENIAEYWVRRGRWYSSSIFGFKRVKDFLKNHPEYAAELAYAITSVVLIRGLYVKFKFEREDGFESWSKIDVKGSTSFSLFGWNIPAASANFNEYTFDKKVDTSEKTVTFQDSSNHCRLVAFRVEKLLDVDEEWRNIQFAEWEDVFPDISSRLATGKVTLRDLEAASLDRPNVLRHLTSSGS